MKKGYKTVVLIAMLCFIMSIPVMAAGTQPERKVVRVGLFPFAGYHEKNDNGDLTGYGFDILQDMLVFENWSYDFVGYDENISWSQAQEMLDKGELDLLTSATMSDERLKKYDYSSIPIGTSSTMLTVRAGDGRFDTSDYSAWDGLRVGMLADNSRNDSFAEYAGKNHFQYQQIEFNTPDELQQELADGNLDMIVTSNLLALSGVKEVDQFDEKPFYVIVKKGNTELLEEVNDALKQVQDSNFNFADDLYSKYYEAHSNGVVTYTKKEQDFITESNQEGKVFKAIINPDRKPLAFYSDNEISGLLVDISKMIFERSGLQIEFLTPRNRDEYIQAINNREADIICDYTGTSSRASENGYVLTNTYYNSSISRLVRRDYSGDGIVCALTKSSITKPLVENQEGIEYVYFDTNEECQDAIRDGKADFTYNYTRVLQEVVYSDARNSFMCVSAKDLSVDFKMAVSLDNCNYLTSIISKSVDSINEEDISYLSEPYTYYDRTNTSLIRVIYDQPIIFIVIIVLLLLTGFALTFIYIFQQRNRKEKELNTELKEANEAKSAFLSRMSHELRTPLNAINGYAMVMNQDIVKHNYDENRARTYMEAIMQAVKYQLSIIGDLLEIQKIESGKIDISSVEVDAVDYMKNIVAMIEPEAKEKGVSFTYKRLNVVNDTYALDGVRLQQVLLNILHNAVKFTPSGGKVTMTAEVLEQHEDTNTLQFVVSDTGIGMSEEFQQEHLFQRFAQEYKGNTSPYEGCGTGLAISREIIHLMGGELSCRSRQGEGSVFTVILPARHIEKKQEKTVKPGNLAYDLSGMRILLCEDNEMNQDMERSLLEKMQGTVEIAADGQIGADMFEQSAEGYYSVILMDIRMPNMDGLESTKAIRAMNRDDAKKIPIFAVSANSFEEDVQKSLAAGMNEHLSKPVDVRLLYAKIKEYCQ